MERFEVIIPAPEEVLEMERKKREAEEVRKKINERWEKLLPKEDLNPHRLDWVIKYVVSEGKTEGLTPEDCVDLGLAARVAEKTVGMDIKSVDSKDIPDEIGGIVSKCLNKKATVTGNGLDGKPIKVKIDE